jgi:MFS family permease
MISKIRQWILNTDPSLRYLLYSDVLLLLAETILQITIPWWVAQQGGAKDVAIYGTLVAIATFVVTPLVSPFGDSIPKRAQIVRGSLVLAVAAFILAGMAAVGKYNLYLLVLVGLVQVVARTFADPASATILPELVPSDRVPEGLRFRKIAKSAGGIAGPVVTGGALAVAGTAAGLWIVGILLIGVALVIMRIPQTIRNEHGVAGFAKWWSDLRVGLVAKWVIPIERGWTLVNFLVWIFEGPSFGILIPIKVQSLGLSGDWLGASIGAVSVGVLLGSFFGAEMLVRHFGRYRVRVSIAAFEGLALALAGYTHYPYVFVFSLVVAGFSNAAMGLVGAMHRTLAIPKAFRVRILSASTMSTQLAGALGPAMVGVALVHWNVDGVYTSFGLVMATLALGFVFVPRAREFFNLSHDEVKDWYLHQYPNVFPVLSNSETEFRGDR